MVWVRVCGLGLWSLSPEFLKDWTVAFVYLLSCCSITVAYWRCVIVCVCVCAFVIGVNLQHVVLSSLFMDASRRDGAKNAKKNVMWPTLNKCFHLCGSWCVYGLCAAFVMTPVSNAKKGKKKKNVMYFVTFLLCCFSLFELAKFFAPFPVLFLRVLRCWPSSVSFAEVWWLVRLAFSAGAFKSLWVALFLWMFESWEAFLKNDLFRGKPLWSVARDASCNLLASVGPETRNGY